VIIDSRSNLSSGSILHVDNVHELVSLQNNPDINIAEVFLVTPRRINRNATLQMNQICSVLRGTDPVYKQTVHAYAVIPAFKLLDAMPGVELADIKDLHEICSFTYPYD
jgi:hypothetical protein